MAGLTPISLLPRPAALPEMATAVLILDERRHVEYANDSAEALFATIDPIGCTLPALLASSGARCDDDPFLALAEGADPATVRVKTADDRWLDCNLRPLSSGGFVLTLDDVTELFRHAQMARQDTLTGLPNRAALRAELIERLRATASAGRTAVFYIDLDRFKAVNDTLGHPIGDILLKKVADRISAALRDGDLVARLGGDEFAVIQSGAAQPAAANALAARLVDLIGRAYAIEGHMVHIGASIGIAMFPGDGHEPDILFKNADLALYRSKAEGRGCFRFFEAGMDDRMQTRRMLEIDLRRGLALRQFEVVYQPQMAVATQQITGCEALLRWHHPERGAIPPGDFIPLAEEIGAIVPIGEWVLRTACEQAARWQAPLSIAVNLSPLQLRSGRLVETVKSALARAALPAERLELEITEGTLLSDDPIILETLKALHAMGVRISMDDFGTGYSSLSYLQKFPFDKVKIDKSFVSGIDAEPERCAIVRAIAALAASLSMSTTAEGVETLAELDCVRREGCTDVQGYLVSRPISATAMAMRAAAPLTVNLLAG